MGEHKIIYKTIKDFAKQVRELDELLSGGELVLKKVNEQGSTFDANRVYRDEPIPPRPEYKEEIIIERPEAVAEDPLTAEKPKPEVETTAAVTAEEEPVVEDEAPDETVTKELLEKLQAWTKVDKANQLKAYNLLVDRGMNTFSQSTTLKASDIYKLMES